MWGRASRDSGVFRQFTTSLSKSWVGCCQSRASERNIVDRRDGCRTLDGNAIEPRVLVQHMVVPFRDAMGAGSTDACTLREHRQLAHESRLSLVVVLVEDSGGEPRSAHIPD
jgi:hypothetical protein